jgi:hypothetical protein
MAKIHLAFRFHINFYHSYRGDKPDETGFGKDMRIIRYILDVLDKHNKNGVPVRGTWDSENYFSLEKLIPKYCPDILERIKKRVDDGIDEMEIMSYNNGLVSSHTLEEFDLMMQKTLSNPQGSGLKDIFKRYAPVVRSQECMMTPALVPLYKKHGVEAITLFYSSIPFNGFSNFVPVLPTEKRYNPLWYRPEGMDDKIVVIPAVGVADVFDNFGIRAYVKRLRKRQLKMQEPKDLLLLVDMDADDDYWRGYFNTYLSEFVLRTKEKTLWQGGLNYMINQVKDLDFVVFDTPYDYLKSHPPVGEVNFTQDTADGSFDGLSPWSDKLDNAKLWTGIDRARTLCEYARAINGKAVEADIKKALEKRILTLSTTHFGLSTPVMCVPRLEAAYQSVKDCVKESKAILEKAQKSVTLEEDSVKAVFQNKYFNDSPKNGFIKMRLGQDFKESLAVKDGKERLSSFVYEGLEGKELRIVLNSTKDQLDLKIERKNYQDKPKNVNIEKNSISNNTVMLKADENGDLAIYYKGELFTDEGSMRFWVEYDNAIYACQKAEIETCYLGGDTCCLIRKGQFCFGKNLNNQIKFVQKFVINGSLPYIYADVEAVYPKTENYKASKMKVKNLKREWDSRWRQIAPFELKPAFRGTDQEPIKVHKHNFFGKVSAFSLNYGTFSKNENIDSMNNAITAGWVAVANKEKGLLISQEIDAETNFAFARMRVRKEGDKNKVFVNPMGTYFGRQLHYAIRRNELVAKGALKFAAQYAPLAPSYSGQIQKFSLMIAPYDGQEPSKQLQNDALTHAYPPHIISNFKGVQDLGLEKWRMDIIK